MSDNYFHYTGSQTLPRAPVSRGPADWGSPPFWTALFTSTPSASDPLLLEALTDCTESVTWIVYERKIAISEAQLGAYRGLLSTVNSKGINVTTTTILPSPWFDRGPYQFKGLDILVGTAKLIHHLLVPLDGTAVRPSCVLKTLGLPTH